MKHTVVAVTVITSMLLAGSAWAATYGWTGLGGDNLWSNGNNWTNVADGSSGTAPGAADTAQFAEFENDVVAVQANVTVANLKLGNGGNSITGAYTITVTGAGASGGFGTLYTSSGSASLGCALSLSQGNHTLVNWNHTLTFNSNVTITTSTGDQTLQINGPNALVVFNGQFRNPNANWSLFAQDDGEFRINATQYNLNKILKLKNGYLVVKGDVYGTADDANQAISFYGDWGASPKVIVFDASGAQTITNRVILHRGAAGNYQEVRFKTKNVNLISKPRVISTANHWYFWNVDQGSYVKVPGFTVSSGLTMCFGGGGTTDVTAAQGETAAFTVILSNGVFLVNNASGNGLNGTVLVCAGAVLGGAGTLNSTITNLSGGIVSPGNSIGTLTTAGNAVFAAGGILNWEVNGATADKLSVNALDISAGAVTVKVVNAGSIQLA